MRRWILIGALLFLGAVAIVGFILWPRESSTEPDLARVIRVDGDQMTIEHPPYGISFEMPVVWDVQVLDHGSGRVSGRLGSADASVYFDITLLAESGMASEQALLQSVLPFTGEPITQKGLAGISYVGRLVDEGGDEWSGYNEENPQDTSTETRYRTDSYLGGRKFPTEAGVIEATCITVGSDYASYISTCTDALDSITKL